MLMVSLRVGGRALPLAWRMKKTQGAMGFSEQKRVLDTVAELLPKDAAVMLMGDRFYGSPALIEWCRKPRLGLAAALQTGPAGLRPGWQRDHARGLFCTRRAYADGY